MMWEAGHGCLLDGDGWFGFGALTFMCRTNDRIKTWHKKEATSLVLLGAAVLRSR